MSAPVPPILRSLALAGLLASTYAAGAWFDVFLGGWRLRACFEPPAAEAQRASALHTLRRLREFASEDFAANRGAVLLLGSSTIERWPLEDCFPGKRAQNHGLANASLELEERVFNACLTSATPAGVVLYAGSLDLREPVEPIEQALARLPRLVQRLRVRYGPSLPITLLGILPARSMDEAAHKALDAANESLRILAREHALAFLPPARAPLASADGTLEASLSLDDLHLNPAGYRVLARWLVTEGGEAGRKLAP